MTELVAGWLLTYLAHSTVLLGLAWLAAGLVSDRKLALRESLWRVALFGGLLTASLQLALGAAPFAVSWPVAGAAASPLAPLLEAHPIPPSPGDLVETLSWGAPPPATAGPAASASWARPLTLGWALIGLALLALLAGSYLRFRWRLRNRTDVVRADLNAALGRLGARSAGAGSRPRPVRLTRCSRISVPLARGVRRREICLPDEALERFALERQEIVLAHELAHLERHDPLWFGLMRIVERVLFFQPLNALARRRLREISEYICDDRAVALTRRPISLARCLTEVAEWTASGRATLPVPTLGTGKTHLSRRVRRLLERRYPMPTESLPRWLVPVASTLLVMVVLFAPGVSVSTPADAAIAPLAAPSAAPAAPEPPSPAGPKSAPAAAPSPAVAPTAPAAPEAPAAPRAPEAPSAPAAVESDPVLFEPPGVLDELGVLAQSFAEIASELDLRLEAELMPIIAEISAEIEPVIAAHTELATELAGEWAEGLELDREQVARIEELAERIAERGHATEAESARLAEMTERLVESVTPSRERLERLHAEARRIREAHREALAAQRERMRELGESEREAMARARAEIRRSLEERRELIERARRDHRESLGTLDREQRERLREEMLRAREQLREQLRQLDEELERQGRED